jgi:hypothetical protein
MALNIEVHIGDPHERSVDQARSGEAVRGNAPTQPALWRRIPPPSAGSAAAARCPGEIRSAPTFVADPRSVGLYNTILGGDAPKKVRVLIVLRDWAA